MGSRQATARNMRSKCRCSCVLQFTFRRAVSCVLHRPPSQVIHCIVLSFWQIQKTERPLSWRKNQTAKFFSFSTSLRGEGLDRNPGSEGRKLIAQFLWKSPSRETEYCTLRSGPPLPTARSLDSSGDVGGVTAKSRRARGARHCCPRCFCFSMFDVGRKSIMILPQVHLRKPCYDFYFL